MAPPAASSDPRVGVGAMIRDAATGRLLVGQRLSSHGHGTWQFPGGHLEYGEAIFACAERETLEETGLIVRATKLAAVTNSVFNEAGKHYITLFVLCEPVDPAAEAQVRATGDDHVQTCLSSPLANTARPAPLTRPSSLTRPATGSGWTGPPFASGSAITTTTAPIGRQSASSCPFGSWSTAGSMRRPLLCFRREPSVREMRWFFGARQL